MYLSKYGFVIKKEEISKEELEYLKNDLIAKPLEDSYQKKDCYNIYIETENKIYIPKNYGLERYGDVVGNREYNGQSIEKLSFNGNLRGDQEETLEIMMESLKTKGGGGIFQCSAGYGKTFLSLKIITEMRVKTLIIVEKISLLNQWKNEISQFIPDAKVGIIQGSICQTVDYDIVIGMIQSLSSKDYSLEKLKVFSMVIIDEVHHSSAKSFSKVLFKVTSKYNIGLSATPNRSDGLEYVFKWHFGDIVCKKTIEKKGKEPIIKTIKINAENYTEIKKTHYSGKEIIQYTSMITKLIEMENRNVLITDSIVECLKDDRKILVLSERRDHLINIEKLLRKMNMEFSVGLFLGGMKKVDLDNSKECNVILATYKSFSEGISVKELNTLIMITPKKFIGHLQNSVKQENYNIERIVGRIFRKEHLYINPLIIDLQDNFSIYKSQSSGRNVFYKQHFQNGIFEKVQVNI